MKIKLTGKNIKNIMKLTPNHENEKQFELENCIYIKLMPLCRTVAFTVLIIISTGISTFTIK